MSEICKFKNALPEKTSVDRSSISVNLMSFWQNRKTRKVFEREKRFRNAERINRLIECALSYCATQLSVIETEV